MDQRLRFKIFQLAPEQLDGHIESEPNYVPPAWTPKFICWPFQDFLVCTQNSF